MKHNKMRCAYVYLGPTFGSALYFVFWLIKFASLEFRTSVSMPFQIKHTLNHEVMYYLCYSNYILSTATMTHRQCLIIFRWKIFIPDFSLSLSYTAISNTSANSVEFTFKFIQNLTTFHLSYYHAG